MTENLAPLTDNGIFRIDTKVQSMDFALHPTLQQIRKRDLKRQSRRSYASPQSVMSDEKVREEEKVHERLEKAKAERREADERQSSTPKSCMVRLQSAWARLFAPTPKPRVVESSPEPSSPEIEPESPDSPPESPPESPRMLTRMLDPRRGSGTRMMTIRPGGFSGGFHTRMMTINPTPQPPPIPESKIIPRFAFDTLPKYVQDGGVRCSACQKRNISYGYHVEVDTDYCKDCAYVKSSVSGKEGWIEFQPRYWEKTLGILRQMAKREHDLRMSSQGQAIYEKYNYEYGYEQATTVLRKQVVQEFATSGLYTHAEEGMDFIVNLPHLLGEEAAELSNYIKGSFAAFPQRFASRQQQGGENKIHVADLKGDLHEFKRLAIGTTVVLAGSATWPPFRHDIPKIVQLIKKYPSLNWMGILNQEAHAQDIWPIGYKEGVCTLKATMDVKSRIANAHLLLASYPELKCFPWYVDVPTKSLYHVGGEFNDVFHCWPHRYLVFSEGKLIFHTTFHSSTEGHFMHFEDLVQFLHKYNDNDKQEWNLEFLFGKTLPLFIKSETCKSCFKFH